MVSLTISRSSQNPLGPRLGSTIRLQVIVLADIKQARLSKVQLTWVQVANNEIHFIYTLLGKVLFITLRVCGQDSRMHLWMQGLDSSF